MKTQSEWKEEINNQTVTMSYDEFKKALIESAHEASAYLKRPASVHDIIRHSGERLGFNKSREYARAYKNGEVINDPT